MFKPKRLRLISGVLVCVVAIFSLLFFVYQRNQTATSIREITKSIQMQDQELFKKNCANYSDGEPISRETMKFFFESFSKKTKESEIRTLFLEKSAFKQENQRSWFKKTKFLPHKRYLTCAKQEDTEINLLESIKNSDNTGGEIRFGPFIPNNYQIDALVVSPIFGSSKERIEANLLKEDSDYTVEEKKLFLNNQEFQQQVLDTTVNYFSSFNECVNLGFNFDRLRSVSEETRGEFQANFEMLKPFLASFEYSFQRLALNTDSLKIQEGANMRLTFDLYIDCQVTTQLIDEPKADFTAQNNAIVTMVFDKESKEWLIEQADFRTFNQDITQWKNVQKFELKKRNHAYWTKNGLDNMV